MPINVKGHMCVLIVCIRDVPLGRFLSFDYQFENKFTCRCGSANCHRTMKGGKAG
jgi:hypothetical protein